MTTDEQQAALEALYEHEGLTDNLNDDLAKALLAWAETQIKGGADPKAVLRAMRAANSDTFTSAEAVVQTAVAALPVEETPAVAQVAPVVVAPEPTPAAQAAPEVEAPATAADHSPAPAAQSGPRQPSALERFVNQLSPHPLFRSRKTPAPPPKWPSGRGQSPKKSEQQPAQGRKATQTGKDAAAAESTGSQALESSGEASEPKPDSARRQKRRSKGKQRR